MGQNLSDIKEINIVYNQDYANRHLLKGWVLIAVNSYPTTTSDDRHASSGNSFVMGWPQDLPSVEVSYNAEDDED